eukprot:1968095-Pyramimonas_sp.AAC.1
MSLCMSSAYLLAVRGLLVAVLSPALNAGREAGREVACHVRVANEASTVGLDAHALLIVSAVYVEGCSAVALFAQVPEVGRH